MKRIILSLALISITVLSACALHAQTATNAPAATTNAAPATPAPLPAASVEQRLESVEAYFSNGDPTAPLKDTNGNIAVTSPMMSSLSNSLGSTYTYPGAGHNAWLLTSTALVLFMTLPGLALFYGGMVRKKNV